MALIFQKTSKQKEKINLQEILDEYKDKEK